MAKKTVPTHKRLVSPRGALKRVYARHCGPGKRHCPDLSKLPPHIKPFANYMVRQRQRGLTPRDVVKAYVLTRSSVQRAGIPEKTVCKTYPGYNPLRTLRRTKDVRPEDAMAALLFTPAGQRYLNAAERGVFDKAAATELGDRMACFGLIYPKGDKPIPTNPKDRAKFWRAQIGLFVNDLKRGPRLALKTDTIAHALEEPAPDWYDYVRKNMKGIGPAKAGFFASLLGRGDIPTFDAREIKLWQQYKPKCVRWKRDARGRKRACDKKKGVLDPTWDDVEKLQARFDRFPMELDPVYEPARAHLVHHALWDAYDDKKPSKTTHGAIIRAMEETLDPGAQRCRLVRGGGIVCEPRTRKRDR